VAFLVRLLFESTLLLGGCLAVILFVLLVHWRRTLRPRPLQIGLAVAVVLLVVQAAVVTRWEHADRIMKRIEAGVRVSRPGAIAATLSARFHVEETGWDREAFIEIVRSYMSWIDVHALSRRTLEITAHEPEAFSVYVSYLADASAGGFRQAGLSRWLIRFTRETDGWRIISIEPTQVDRTSVRGWRGLPRP
jgi:hypothetical protein